VDKIKTKKGFLFVVTIFLILTYILLSISVWVKAIETSERSYSEFYKESNVELAIEQISPHRIANVSTIVLNRGLMVLVDHSVDYPLKNTTDPNDYTHIEAALGEFLINGSPKAEHFENDVAPSEYNSSMSGWADNLNASLSAIGVYMDEFSVSNFRLSQSTYDKLDYSYDVNFTVRDKSGSTFVERDYTVNGEIDLNGFRDPGIMRESDNKIRSRRIFFNSTYDAPSTLKPTGISGFNQESGQGWFYGFVVEYLNANSIPAYERSRYMVVGTFDELRTYSSLGDFGAFIVTTPAGPGSTCTDTNGVFYEGDSKTFNPITYKGKDCTPTTSDPVTSQPYVVAPEFNISHTPPCPPMNGSATLDRHCVMFVTGAEPMELSKKKQKSNIHFYDIEKVRDYTMCGYYTQNSDAPSFLQRLFNNSYTFKSNFGIETFIIGNYSIAAFSESKIDQNSNLDRELFADDSGPYIRGLPGCKDASMCAASNKYTGRFSLTDTSIKNDYLFQTISCANGLAGCD
jgi:hypothetical protein